MQHPQNNEYLVSLHSVPQLPGSAKFQPIGPLAPTPGRTVKTLNVTVQQQEASQWCWSACAVSIADYYAPPTKWTQCSLASRILASTCCARPERCDRAARLGPALRKVGRPSRIHKLMIPFADLMTAIERSQPPCVRIQWARKDPTDP